jgi:drug/metabolite transporter (DMT)-like permease
MIFLLLSILSSASIFVIFKLIGRFKIFTFSAIVVNYLAACFAGFFLSNSNPYTFSVFHQNWFPVALLIGVMFVVMFYIIGSSTQKAGVAVTTVAVKMSVIFPIAFSIWFDLNDRLTFIKLLGISLALVSVYLTVYKKDTNSKQSLTFFLPIILFVGMGIVDTFVKYAQSAYVSTELTPIFSTITFSAAAITGLLVLTVNHKAAKNLLQPKTWLLGCALGLANFGSMYFLLLALNHIDTTTGLQAMGSVTFGINNIGIVTLSVIIGFLFYSERPSKINWIGIALSLISILILSYSQM